VTDSSPSESDSGGAEDGGGGGAGGSAGGRLALATSYVELRLGVWGRFVTDGYRGAQGGIPVVRWCREVAVAPPRPQAVSRVGGGGAVGGAEEEVEEELRVRRRPLVRKMAEAWITRGEEGARTRGLRNRPMM
jgi:hypothetical protein